jgi:hypothetical protein
MAPAAPPSHELTTRLAGHDPRVEDLKRMLDVRCEALEHEIAAGIERRDAEAKIRRFRTLIGCNSVFFVLLAGLVIGLS